MANPSRYERMKYLRCGRSGIKLPAISLGLWQNFGGGDDFRNSRSMITHAFDLGITHFDLANNYGPPYGSAEITFGRVLHRDLRSHRDELIISTKAGWDMWPGPYGNFGSRKYLIASLDQSLRRMGLEYVDIFYHHRPDPETPLEETMGALADIVHSGKALYAGISQYQPAETRTAASLLRSYGSSCFIHQPRYNMLDRWIEDGLIETLRDEGIGCIVFSPLAQGLLTDKYLEGIPPGSRASKEKATIRADRINAGVRAKLTRLNDMAASRGQSLAQLALCWALRNPVVTSALIGAHDCRQIDDAVGALAHPDFAEGDLDAIEQILKA